MTMRAATLSRVIQTAADRGRSGTTDRDLLRRFADSGDESAFEVLVRRHSGLVLGVCRRALSNAQDAEDACQATFLVLARKARSGRWQPSIANWLFATARKVSHDLRRARDRRAKREGRAAVPEAVEPVDQMTGRELLAAIDEELDRLPAIYRESLLLYYQAELAREEIAARLGVPPGTVKIRLERGRKRLGGALEKRGLTLGAGLLALMATSRAGASPPRVEAIQSALAGNTPPAVAALAEGFAVNGLVKKSLLAAVLMATAAAVGFVLGEPRATTAGQQSDKAMPAKAAAKTEAPAAAAEKKAEDRTITGKVLDPDGKSVGGAEIIHLPIDGTAVVAGKTAADGSFKVTVPLKAPGSRLFPRVAGFASSDYLMPATNTPSDMTFRLVKDTPIRGRLMDTQGKPVAGASVVVRHLMSYGDTLDGFLAGWQKRPADGNGPNSKWFLSFRSWDNRNLAKPGDMFAAVTDQDGRFTIENVGSERVANLHIRGPGIAEAPVVIVLRAGFDPEPYNRETLVKLKSSYSELGYHPMFHPPETTVVAEAEKPIRGVVKDTATGQPRAGVTVTFRDPKNDRMPDLMSVTDKDGRYAIHGARKAAEYQVSVKRDPEVGYIGRKVTAKDTPAYEPVTLDIGVAKGIILTGRLLDDQTGEPVPGFVCAGVLYDNEAAKDRPEFDSPDSYDFADAKVDGTYRTVVPPGPVLVMAGVRAAPGKGPTESKYEQMKIDAAYPHYFDNSFSGFRSPGGATTIMQGQWCKVFHFKLDEPTVTFDVRFKPASRFEVKVRGPDGKPLTGVMAAGNTARDWSLPEECKTDTCIVHELENVKPRLVVFLEPKRHLVGTLTLKGDEKGPAVVTLGAPGRVKGRLVDAAGKPIAHSMVSLGYERRAADEIDRLVNGDWRSSEPKVETNANGEFAVDMVIPGETFIVYARRKEKFLEPTDKTAKVTVKAAESKDLGTVTMKGQ